MCHTHAVEQRDCARWPDVERGPSLVTRSESGLQGAGREHVEEPQPLQRLHDVEVDHAVLAVDARNSTTFLIPCNSTTVKRTFFSFLSLISGPVFERKQLHLVGHCTIFGSGASILLGQV